MALKNNLDIQIDRRATDIARYAAEGAYGAFDPALAFQAMHSYNDMPLYLVADKANPDFPYKADREDFGTSLKGKLRATGLAYDLGARAIDFRHVRTDFNLTPEQNARFLGSGSNDTFLGFPSGIRRANNYYMEAGLTLRQPLLKNGWIDAERHLIRLNKKEQQMSEVALRGVIMKTINTVQRSYYELMFAQETIKVQQKALESASQALKETQARLKVGELRPLDEQQALVHQDTIQSDLFGAEQVFIQQQNLLKQYLTDDFNAWRDIELHPTEELIAAPEAYDKAQSWQNALTKRSDILQMKLELERQHIILKYDYNQLWPSLDVFGSVGVRSSSPDFGDATRRLGDGSNPFYSFGGILTIPLWNRGPRAAFKATKAAEEQALLRMKKLEQIVLNEVDTASKIIQSTYKRVGSTRKARNYAEDLVSAERKLLEQGATTNFGLLEAQRNLTAARSAEVRALADYNKARADLSYREGITLEKNNLRLEMR